MSVSALFSVLKHFSPLWFRAIAKEAEKAPATIAGLFFVWVTIAVGGLVVYAELAKADSERNQLTEIVAKNTAALDCSRRDRQIAAQYRQLQNLQLLIDRSEDNVEVVRLTEQMDELRRQTSILETAYSRRCL